MSLSFQTDVYSDTTKELIPFVLQGYNATVFAYGPTGSGKTYTMVGTHEQPGIMVMALNDLFSLMKKGEEKFTVSIGAKTQPNCTQNADCGFVA